MIGYFFLWFLAACLAFALGIAAGRLVGGFKKVEPPKPAPEVSPVLKQIQFQLDELIHQGEEFIDESSNEPQQPLRDVVAGLHTLSNTLVHACGIKKQPGAVKTRASSRKKPAAHALETDPIAQTSERRGNDRRSFQFQQLIALYNGRRMPEARSFRLYECRDVSTRGMSFYSNRLLTSGLLLVRLGNATSGTFLVAQVVRTDRAKQWDDFEYCIACKFVEALDQRLVPPALQSQLNELFKQECCPENLTVCETIKVS